MAIIYIIRHIRHNITFWHVGPSLKYLNCVSTFRAIKLYIFLLQGYDYLKFTAARSHQSRERAAPPSEHYRNSRWRLRCSRRKFQIIIFGIGLEISLWQIGHHAPTAWLLLIFVLHNLVYAARWLSARVLQRGPDQFAIEWNHWIGPIGPIHRLWYNSMVKPMTHFRCSI